VQIDRGTDRLECVEADAERRQPIEQCRGRNVDGEDAGEKGAIPKISELGDEEYDERRECGGGEASSLIEA
jgi:hypothetical protein